MLLVALLGCQPEPVATHDTLPLAEDVAATGLARWDGDWSFDWIPTVWAYGLHRLHAATGDDAWQDPYRAWLADHVAPYADDPPRGFNGSDSMSPAILASVLLADDPGAAVEPIVAAGHRWIDEAPRTDEGAIEHWGDGAPFGVPGQVWVDSQFMVGMFLLSEHARTGDALALDEFAAQYALFSDLLRDPATDLYRHAYDDATDANIPVEPTFWARGNSWVLVSASQALTLDADLDLRADFVAQARAVAALQADDGLWRTVLDHADDPANYTETSASALIAYAFVQGVDAGVLDAAEFVPVVDRAVLGLQARVEYDDGVPVVEGTSYGTVPGDYDYYVGVGRHDDLMLGVGAVTMLFAEAHGFPREAP